MTLSIAQEADSSSTEATPIYPHKFRGDMLAIVGGLLYGLNDVLTEICVQSNGGTAEYLGTVGFFASIIAIIQALLLERSDIMEFFARDVNVDESSESCSIFMGWMLYVAYVSLNVAAYIGGSYFLILSEAAFFNLSLLTGDLYSVIFSVVAEKIVPSKLFFIALLFVMSGVIIYEMAPSPIVLQTTVTGMVHDDNSDNKTAPRIVPSPTIGLIPGKDRFQPQHHEQFHDER